MGKWEKGKERVWKVRNRTDWRRPMIDLEPKVDGKVVGPTTIPLRKKNWEFLSAGVDGNTCMCFKLVELTNVHHYRCFSPQHLALLSFLYNACLQPLMQHHPTFFFLQQNTQLKLTNKLE